MILPTFDPAAVLMLAAFLHPSPQEPAVDTTPNSYARLLHDSGFYGPFTARADRSGIIEDRDGHPRFLILPGIEGQSDRATAAEIVTLALSRLCGFRAVEDKLDPEHINDVRAESARFRAQTDRLADAAE